MSGIYHLRAAQADREGYYHTRWDQATPLEVAATSKAEALNKAEALLGPPRRGSFWAYRVDRIVAVQPCETCGKDTTAP